MKISSLALILLISPSICWAEYTLLRACGGQAEWPPSSYFADKQKRTVTGYSVDILNKIFEYSGYQIEVQLLPWARCLAEVQKGIEYQIAMAVSRSPERETKYVFSKPYLFLTPGLVSIEANKKPPLAHLKTTNKCGINGFNYQPYDMFVTSELDTTANNYESVIRKLTIGRCDYLLEYTEVAQSLINLEQYGFEKNTFKVEKIAGAKPVAAHFGLGINTANSKEILNIINDKLTQLENNGKLKSILNKHTQP